MSGFLTYFLYFIIYSVLGWIGEIIWCSIAERKLVKERGFLLGPWCPIYGTGALIIIILLKSYKEDPLVLFILIFVFATILEYITSYIMEKLFDARWWDYSNAKFNVEGRICLLNSTAFGFAGLFLINIVHPIILSLVEKINPIFFTILSVLLLLIFIIDLAFTILSLVNLKKIIENLKRKIGDKRLFQTGFSDYFQELLSKTNKMTKFGAKNIVKSFPKLTTDNNKINETLKEYAIKKREKTMIKSKINKSHNTKNKLKK